jgi:two-component system NarL family response regulator
MLVDDHRILREAIRTILEKSSDILVVAEADDGPAALRLAQSAAPDVVVMDIGLSDMSGIEATRRLIAENAGIKVLALSMYSDRRMVLQMLQAGASGYVVKAAGSEELLRAIQAVAAGKTYLCAEVMGSVVDQLRDGRLKTGGTGASLGRRERDVLQLLANGMTSLAIAEKLNIAASTVEVHRRNIMRKLDLHTVAELTKYAIREGLTSA